MKKNLLCLLALVLVFSLSLTGCGSDKSEESSSAAPMGTPEAAPPLGLDSWELTASTWSSPNGATVHLTATPYGYAEGYSASFVVRLEGEDVENVPCEWDGTHYTASAELNAADGLCYYVLMTAADGNTSEIAVNTPNTPTDDSLINLQSALQAYCALTISASEQSGSKMTITDGTAKIQLPQITNAGETIAFEYAKLMLVYDGKETEAASLVSKLGAPTDGGLYDISLAGTAFDVPEMQDDQRAELRLDVKLSNGQVLTDVGGSWIYNGGQLLLAAG